MSNLDVGPVEVIVNGERYARETTLFAALESADEARQLTHRLSKTIQDLEEALRAADEYLAVLDDDAARDVRRKIQDVWPKWVKASALDAQPEH